MTKDLKSDRWTCPNDRNLQLRSKLNAGWSYYTGRKTLKKEVQLSETELIEIQKVLQRSEMVERNERERVLKLVDRLENMKRNANQSGCSSPNRCALCGDYFCLIRSVQQPNQCGFCHKILCSKCCIDTQFTVEDESSSVHSSSQSRRNSSTSLSIQNPKVVVWLCRLCSEQREFLKKSGAWFHKKYPNYVQNGEKYNSTSNVNDQLDTPSPLKQLSFASPLPIKRNISMSSSNSSSFRFWKTKENGQHYINEIDNISDMSNENDLQHESNSNYDSNSVTTRTASSENLNMKTPTSPNKRQTENIFSFNITNNNNNPISNSINNNSNTNNNFSNNLFNTQTNTNKNIFDIETSPKTPSRISNNPLSNQNSPTINNNSNSNSNNNNNSSNFSDDDNLSPNMSSYNYYSNMIMNNFINPLSNNANNGSNSSTTTTNTTNSSFTASNSESEKSNDNTSSNNNLNSSSSYRYINKEEDIINKSSTVIIPTARNNLSTSAYNLDVKAPNSPLVKTEGRRSLKKSKVTQLSIDAEDLSQCNGSSVNGINTNSVSTNNLSTKIFANSINSCNGISQIDDKRMKQSSINYHKIVASPNSSVPSAISITGSIAGSTGGPVRHLSSSRNPPKISSQTVNNLARKIASQNNGILTTGSIAASSSSAIASAASLTSSLNKLNFN